LSLSHPLRILIVEARVDWTDARPGTRAVLTMHLDTEEAQF
jgi:hypothetical protein